MWTMVSHLSVPYFQVVIRDFPSGIKDHDASMGTIIVTRVKLIEGILTCGIPDVYFVVFSVVVLKIMSVHGQGMRR